VLVLDLDQQGDLGNDLGYHERGKGDGGTALMEALTYDRPVKVLADVRPKLDVVPGGPELRYLRELEDRDGGHTIAERLRRQLTDAVKQRPYDLVFIDCPPGDGTANLLALHCARYIIVPTMTDDASIEGLYNLGPRVAQARQTNPGISYLGVVFFAHDQRATAILADAKRKVDETLQGTVAIFDTVIRHTRGAANSARAEGKLVHELAVDAREAAMERISLLRKYRAGQIDQLPRAASTTAVALADDYGQLTGEIFTRTVEAESHAQNVVKAQ
jgi:cellulose biosynthesis protein BcsQ